MRGLVCMVAAAVKAMLQGSKRPRPCCLSPDCAPCSALTPRPTAHAPEWRKAFPKQYREAYVALSLPRLLAPTVRLEMMDWEPLTGECGAVALLGFRCMHAGVRAAHARYIDTFACVLGEPLPA